MDKKIKFLAIVFAIIVLIIIVYFVVILKSPPISINEMKSCIANEDCVSVGCNCHCSGCGGFSYDDIVNKKYVNAWYSQKDCKPAEICPDVCCPKRTIACEDNICVVKEGK